MSKSSLPVIGHDAGVDIGSYCKLHVEAALPVLSLLAILSAVLGLVLAVGGAYLAFFSRLAETSIELFGSSFRSTSVGVTLAAIGAVVFVVAGWRIMRTLHLLAALPPDDYHTRLLDVLEKDLRYRTVLDKDKSLE